MKYIPNSGGGLPEFVGIFDLPVSAPKAKDDLEQEKQDLKAAFDYLKTLLIDANIISIEKLHPIHSDLYRQL